MGDVLVVDDDPAIRDLVQAMLESRGHRVRHAETCADARRRAQDFEGVVVLDVQLPDGLGPDLLPDLKRLAPTSPVVVLTGHGTGDLALSALRAGAFDFLQKGHLAQRLTSTVELAFAEREAFIAADAAESRFPRILTRSRLMRTKLRALDPAVDSGVPVLVRGESGTGKELVARGLHDSGPRSNGPFIAVNCAGIPDNLLEAELFGYEKGAFTGATRRKPGRFDLARGGTLVLDEIGEMHPRLQAKLLRVLQEGEYQRLGGVENIQADVRVVSATHRDLEAEVAAERFRHDLYYRLAVYTVALPSLRDRAGDVPFLATHFVDRASRRERKRVRDIDPLAVEVLESYRWPGNVRQLENVISHAVVACRDTVLGLADLPESFLRAVQLERADGTPQPVAEAEGPPVSEGGNILTLRAVERRHIESVIHLVKGNKTQAARKLGVSRMTLYRKLEEYQLS